MIALASHQCGPTPGSNPGPGVIHVSGLSLLLVLVLAPRVFLRHGSPVLLPPQKSTFLNSNSIGNSRATGLSVMCYPRKIKLINYYYSLVFKMSLGQQKSVFLILKPYKTGLILLRKKSHYLHYLLHNWPF